MIKEKFIIHNSKGIHLRPAGILCKEALEFKCSVKLVVGSVTADAKSVLGVLAVGIKCGTEIELVCDGADEKEAMDRLRSLINSELET